MFRYACIVLIFIESVNAIDLPKLSILRYNSSLYCMVSNESINSAITWDTGYDTISYDYYRITEKDDLENRKWKLKNSLENEFKFGPILDYRWESFPLNNECKYKLPSRRPFEIYISMQDTVINICETEGSRRCYKIIFGDNGPYQVTGEPRKLCTEYNKPQKTKWLHFTLRAAGNFFHIEQYGKENALDVIRTHFSASYLVIDSKWKIHSLNVYSSNTDSNQEIQLVNNFSQTEDICLGLFVYVCNTCTLLLKLYNRSRVEIASTVTTKKLQWDELKICGKVSPGDDMKLSITTESVLSIRQFYIADSIRKFGKNSVRSVILPNVEERSEAHCCYDIMSSKELCTKELNQYNPLPSDNNCSLTTIGASCIPCQKIFNQSFCDNVPICDLTYSGDIACSCPSGYLESGCGERCPSNHYGFDCRVKCENCLESCNRVTGDCDARIRDNSCCSKVNIFNVTQTSVSILWDISTDERQTLRYYVKYWHTNFRGCHPGNVTKKVETGQYTEKTSITLTDLIPYSNYTVQIFSVTSFSLTSIKEVNISTLAADILSQTEVSNITSIQTGTSLEVNLIIEDCARIKGPISYKVELICTSQWCSMSDNATKIISYTPGVRTSISTHTILGNTNYTINVRAYRNSSHADREQPILTTPTAPGAVRNVTAYSVTQTSIALRWSEPYPPTGLLEEYNVTYWGCCPNTAKSQTIKANSSFCTIWKNQICSMFDALAVNLEHTFRIQAKNLNVSEVGPWEEVHAITRNREPGEPENLAYIWNETTNALILKWNHPSTPNGRITHFDILKPMQRIATYDVIVEQFQYTYEIQYDKLNISSSQDIMINIYAFNSIGNKSSTLRVSTPPKTPIFLEYPILLDITATFVKVRVSQTAGIDGERSNLYVIITVSKGSASNSIQHSDDDSIILKEANISTELNNSWIALKFPLDNVTGNTLREILLEDEIQLDSEKIYQVTLFLRNEYRNISRHSGYTLGITAPASQNYKLLLFLLVIPVICFIIFIIYKRNTKATRNQSTELLPMEHTYEELDLPSTNSSEGKLSTFHEELLAKNEKYCKPIRIQVLQNYVKQSLQHGELEEQYGSIQTGQTKEWKCGMKSENIAKNRYKNVAAYDDTRVKLKTINNNPYSDYINANYIDGYDIKRSYIATQGPKSNTINDFWRMIWEENVEYVIMIANIIEDGKKKVEKYWPDIGETNTYGDIMVTFLELTVFPEYENKILKITSKGEVRGICHLHFTCWPNHGVAFYAQSLAPFLKRTLTIPHGKSPIVVHCSAGVGRTGTLILCDICLRMAEQSGEVDIYYQLRKLREQRINMVDNMNQYKLVHLVLLNCLVAPDFTIQCTEEMYKAIDEVLSPTKISEQMRYIDETYWQDETMRSVCAKIDEPIVPEKNRFQNIVPDNYARISLIPFPLSDKSSSYINAVKVDGFCVPLKFIVTQYPLNNTLGDFWRLIDQYDISLIICLNELDMSDETCCKFYPALEELMRPTPYLAVECIDILKGIYYNIHVINFNNSNKEEGQRIIKFLQLNKWKYSMLHPETTTELLIAYEEMNSLGKTSKTILVTCLDGTRASGLFTSLCCLVDKIEMEQVCDVCLAVRTVRHGRAEFVRESEQFSFLYKCGLDYAKHYGVVSNVSSRT